MSAPVSRKLSNSFEGALAGGGDPATSPLYVFGPFLKMIVVAGVAEVTFGASIWLVILTVAVVSAMYRLVMQWVTDGSGGSGLTEEEFGGWAVKINASITFIEYTLTFLVSIAALVTFIADRVPALNEPLLANLTGRLLVAIALSVLTGWLVNLGPKVAARTFGPATLAVLALLWSMIIATILKMGLHLPPLHLEAFTPKYLPYTLGGYARILALMTGIEVFANLVAAYEGTPEEKARKAFGSLLIIMGSTGLTMLIVGPAIYKVADPLNEQVSVFTQTMDYLLPDPLPYIGTLIGVVVLLSASAASAQGIQNLSLGLKDRHYVPPVFGRRNKYGVPPWPVWTEVAVVSLLFIAFGTREETYLSLYAAGVFILLSMTSWAVMKRLWRNLRSEFDLSHLLTLIGSFIAAVLTTIATLIIFGERLKEGAWIYFVLIPLLYAVLTYFRNKLGAPSPLKENLGKLEGGSLLIDGEPKMEVVLKEEEVPEAPVPAPVEELPAWARERRDIHHILVPLYGSPRAEQALDFAKAVAKAFGARITLLAVLRYRTAREQLPKELEALSREKAAYLGGIVKSLREAGLEADYRVEVGPIVETIDRIARAEKADLLAMTTHSRNLLHYWMLGSKASKILQRVNIPMLVIHPKEERVEPRFSKILVSLDGSEYSERVLAYVFSLAPAFKSNITLLSVPEISVSPAVYGSMADYVAKLQKEAERKTRTYLERVAAILRSRGLQVSVVVGSGGDIPSQAIIAAAERMNADLIMMATHGRGGLDRILVGSTTERVIQGTDCPLFLLPIPEKRNW